MLSELPRSTLRPCSWCALHRYVGASSTATCVMSIGLLANAAFSCSIPSRPTGAETLTGAIRLAANAKYTTDPTTSSSGVSGTPSRAARRGHDVTGVPQLRKKIIDTREVFHLHPASAE